MSHPPETSRELAEVLFKLARATPNDESIINFSTGKQTLPLDRGIALIDAWVRVRELEAQVTSVTKILLMAEIGCFGYHPTGCRHCQSHDYRRELESALATARASS